MSKATPATRFLDRSKATYRIVSYDYAPGAERIGLQAAQAIGMSPDHVLKTLMTEVDGKPACVVLPADRTLSMKKVAAAFGGKSAAMMPPEKAERLTGFHTGGISPFGQKRQVPTAIERTAIRSDEVAINGGKRGLMVVLPADLAARLLRAIHAPLVAE